MISALTAVGQLKRKGKFAPTSEYMRNPQKSKPSQNAISNPNAGNTDVNILMYANLTNKPSQKLDDINGT